MFDNVPAAGTTAKMSESMELSLEQLEQLEPFLSSSSCSSASSELKIGSSCSSCSCSALRSGLFALLLPLVAASTQAQIIGRRAAGPTTPTYIGGGIGILQGFSVNDGSTGSTWQFGTTMGYLATIERPTQSGILLGLEGMYAKPNLSYSSGLGSQDASGRIIQAAVLLHSPNEYSFHSAYQLTLGGTGFSNFREQTTGAKLGPSSTDWDFSFTLGYGLGFGISDKASLEVVQEFGWILHQQTGLAAGASSYPRISVTKLAGKIAF